MFGLFYDSLGPVWGFPTNFGYLVDLLFKLEVIQNFRPVRFSPGLFLVLYGLGERGFNSFCCTYVFLKLPPFCFGGFALPFAVFRFGRSFFRSMATLALPLFWPFFDSLLFSLYRRSCFSATTAGHGMTRIWHAITVTWLRVTFYAT